MYSLNVRLTSPGASTSVPFTEPAAGNASTRPPGQWAMSPRFGDRAVGPGARRARERDRQVGAGRRRDAHRGRRPQAGEVDPHPVGEALVGCDPLEHLGVLVRDHQHAGTVGEDRPQLGRVEQPLDRAVDDEAGAGTRRDRSTVAGDRVRGARRPHGHRRVRRSASGPRPPPDARRAGSTPRPTCRRALAGWRARTARPRPRRGSRRTRRTGRRTSPRGACQVHVGHHAGGPSSTRPNPPSRSRHTSTLHGSIVAPHRASR